MTATTEDQTATYYGYACPVTHLPLAVIDADTLESEQADLVFNAAQGVPNFLLHPAVEDRETTSKLEQLVDLAKKVGCENALKQVDSDSLAYLLDESRAKYLELLPLTDESRVLEIGASKGQHTRLIARLCKSLYALETVREQAAFGALWCSEQGVSNVKFAAGGDDCRLPYLDGFFDTVILNHVFEWCAARASDAPSAGQKQMLSECHRVLAPGGCLFLSTKNRFSARLLAGAIDEHNGMRFGNALPRWLMKLCLHFKGKTTTRALLYSYDGLKNMLINIGFNQVDPYLAIPDARYPVAYVQLDKAGVAVARKNTDLRHVNKLWNILLGYTPDYLLPRTAPSLVFLATKS